MTASAPRKHYRGYRARNPLGPHQPPRETEIVRAIPPGSRRLRGRRIGRLYADAVAVVLGDRVRADARANVLELARAMAARADWETGATRDSRTARCASAGVAVSTWKAARRRLEAAGCLGTVRPGRKYHHGDQVRHDAAVYVLCAPKWAIRKIAAKRRRLPRWPITRPPTVSPEVSIQNPRGAPSTGPGQEQTGPPASGRARSRGGPRNAELAAGTAAGRALAAVVRRAAGQSISDGWAGHLVRPFLAAGWTPRDLQRAIESPPSGYVHGYGRDPRSPVGWLRWRLGRWLDHGEPVASPSRRDAAAAAALAAEQEAARAAWITARRPPADPRPHIDRIFASMGWRHPGTPPGKPPRTGES